MNILMNNCEKMGFSEKPKLTAFASPLQYREFLSALRLISVFEAEADADAEYTPVTNPPAATTTCCGDQNDTQIAAEPIELAPRDNSKLVKKTKEPFNANSIANLVKLWSSRNGRLKELLMLMMGLNRIKALPILRSKVVSGAEFDRWEKQQKCILIQVHRKLKQLIEVKANVKNLRRNKRIILKEKNKFEKRQNFIEMQSNENPSPSQKTPPSSDHATIASISDNIASLPCDEFDLVTIGPNGTKIAKAALQNIKWSLKGANIVRKVLMEVFDRDILASHSLTGKPSPAFVGCKKQPKGRLDPLKVADIVHLVTKYLKDMTEKDVRQAITTKCADENKMLRQRKKKRKITE